MRRRASRSEPGPSVLIARGVFKQDGEKMNNPNQGGQQGGGGQKPGQQQQEPGQGGQQGGQKPGQQPEPGRGGQQGGQGGQR
jgi:hypothetical protein